MASCQGYCQGYCPSHGCLSMASCQDLSGLSKVRCYLDRLLSRLLSKSWVLVNGKLSRLVRLVQGKVLLGQAAVKATVQVMTGQSYYPSHDWSRLLSKS